MAFFSKSIQALNEVSGSILKAVEERPGLAALTGGAAILSPFFIKNKDRSYAQSVLLTTPIVAATSALAYHKAFSGISREAHQLFTNAKFRGQTISESSPATIEELTKIRNTKRGFNNAYNATLYNNYFNKRSNTSMEVMKEKVYNQLKDWAPTALSQEKTLEFDLLKAMGKDPQSSFNRYLSNAFQTSLYKHGDLQSITQYEMKHFVKWIDKSGNTLANTPKIDSFVKQGVIPKSKSYTKRIDYAVPPDLSMEEVVSGLEGQIKTGNLDFVKSFSSKLDAFKNADYGSGVFQVLSESQLPKMNYSFRTLGQINKNKKYKSISRQGWKELQEFSSTLPNEKQPLIATQGKKIIGFQHDQSFFPFVSDKTQEVRKGLSGQSVGIARKVYTESEGMLNPDVYAIRALKKGHNTSAVQKDLSRYIISSGIDINEDWTNMSLGPGEDLAQGTLNKLFRKNQFLAGNLYGFTEEGKDIGFGSLSPAGKESILKNLATKVGTKIGSEGSFYKGVFETKEIAEYLTPFGISNTEKQNVYWRSLSKSFSLEAPNNSIRPSWAPKLVSEIEDVEGLKSVETMFKGITPQQKTFFEMMGESVEEFQSNKDKLVNFIMDKEGVDILKAEKVYNKINDLVKNKDVAFETLKQTRYIGEGTLLTSPDSSLSLTGKRIFHLTQIESNKPFNELKGIHLSNEDSLGYYYGERIMPKGISNTIEDVQALPNGEFSVLVKEKYPFSSGIKLDVGGIKGLGQEALNIDIIDEALSGWNEEISGFSTLSEGKKVFSLSDSGIGKSDPMLALHTSTGFVMKEAEKAGHTNLVQEFSEKLHPFGQEYKPGIGLVYNPDLIPNIKQFDAKSKLELFSKERKVIEDLFSKVEHLAVSGQMTDNKIWSSASMASKSGVPLGRFLTEYNLPTVMMAWNHTLLNKPDQVKVTYDVLRGLSQRGYHDVSSELQGRLKPSANTTLNRSMEEYLAGDTSKITNVVDINNGIPLKRYNNRLEKSYTLTNTNDLPYTSSTGRMGTIFDPSISAYNENYLLKLSDNSTIPILGHEAHGAQVNRFPGGGYSLNPIEKQLDKVIQKNIDLLNIEDTAKFIDQPVSEEVRNKALSELEKAKSSYLNEVKSTLYGKESYLRSSLIDAEGAGSFLQYRASTLKYDNGNVNPFEVGISESTARNLKDKRIRKLLQEGESVPMVVYRHPVSTPLLAMGKLDSSLKNNEIGITDPMRLLARADFDQDPSYLLPFHPESKAGKQISDVVKSTDSFQSLEFSKAKDILGTSDISAEQSVTRIKPLKERLFSYLANFNRGEKVFAQRTTAATIGQFSNLSDLMSNVLIYNSQPIEKGELATLNQLIFEIRQVTISAAKAKNESGLTIESASRLANTLSQRIKNRANPKEVVDLMMQVYKAHSSEVFEAANKNRELLERFISGTTKTALDTTEALSASQKIATAIAGDKLIDKKSLYYIRNIFSEETEEVSKYIPNMASRISSESLGFANDLASSGVKILKGIKDSKSLKILGVGAAVAAGIGFFNTSIKSSNNIRPESQLASNDANPGDAVPGSMSARPPLNQIETNKTNINYSVVAPINQRSNISINMVNDDNRKLSDFSKNIGRFSTNGDSNVTVNYRNDFNHLSLRDRQRIKDRINQS